MSARADKGAELSCEACGDAFMFTAGEQAFYAKKSFIPPKRCEPCRSSRRQSRAHDVSDPAIEERGVDVVCSACGALTRLPFLPTKDRPVYCKPCFRNR